MDPEVLEGAIHLLRCEILHPLLLEATWIISDLEDNLYLSEEYGYQILGQILINIGSAGEDFRNSHGCSVII